MLLTELSRKPPAFCSIVAFPVGAHGSADSTQLLLVWVPTLRPPLLMAAPWLLFRPAGTCSAFPCPVGDHNTASRPLAVPEVPILHPLLLRALAPLLLWPPTS